MNLSKAHWRFVLLKQASVSVAANVVEGALIAWLLFRNDDTVSLSGQNSYAFDVVASTFFFMFVTSWFTSKATYKAVERGHLDAVEWENPPGFIQRHPPRPFLGSLILAVIATLLISPATAGALTALDADVMTSGEFVWFKAFYMGTLAAIVTPIVALISLTEAEPKAARR